MLRWNKIAIFITAFTGMAAAQPALTTIQDTLYRADGTRFTGTMYVTYDSFQAGDTSNIATANLTMPIVNGSLRLRLTPTTTASAGAQYRVTYNSAGINQFTETWAVPATSATLRVRDVRLSTGTVVGPPPVTSPVQIGDVVGLLNELDVRPIRGAGYGIGRAAVLNSAGQLDAASGSLSDCLRVDGGSGPCGTGGNGITAVFSDEETPGGAVNGSNATFVLAHAPNPPGSLHLIRNGLVLQRDTDYQLTGSSIVFFAGAVPQPGDLLRASYRYGDPNNPLGTLTASQVVCSMEGGTTSSGTVTELGSCTLPSGILDPGDRLEIRYQLEHSGSAAGFTSRLLVGATQVAQRAAPSSETRLAGHSDFTFHASAESWDSRTWGSSLSFETSAGGALESSNQPLTIRIQGQLSTTAADTLSLRNFTVIRYPAQAN